MITRKKLAAKCVFVLLLLPLYSCADTLYGKVVAIADGDTVTILDHEKTQHKIRLIGIDAPESKQPFGNASKRKISDMIAGQLVQVDYHKRDRYGRILGKVYINGSDINLQQIQHGMAWHYKQYQNDQMLEDRLLYSAAENTARMNKIGLWQDVAPIPPWEWRRQVRNKANKKNTH